MAGGFISKVLSYLKQQREKRKVKAAKFAAEQERRNAEYEEIERRKSYFEFWRYRGKVYGIKKSRYTEGDYSYARTEFYLDITGHKEQRVIVDKCNLAIANGHDVIVTYARGASQKTGYCVRVQNVSAKIYTDIDDGLEMTCKAAKLSRAYGLKRLNMELERNQAAL